MNIFHNLFQEITVTITSIFIVVTSIFTGQKPAPTPIPPQAEKITESSPSASPVTKSPLGEKQVPKETQGTSTSLNPSSQKTNSVTQENKTKAYEVELQKIDQVKQQPAQTQNLVSSPTPTPTALNNQPITNPANNVATNQNIYSDYNFGYTYSGEVSPSSKMKILQFSATSRDLRLARAIFRISNEDAEKYDSMDSSKYSHTTVMWFCKSSCRSYTLERTDKNTFLYVGSRTGGLQIAQGHIYVEIQIPTFAEGFITTISLPMSEWEIWDNSTGKLVKTQ